MRSRRSADCVQALTPFSTLSRISRHTGQHGINTLRVVSPQIGKAHKVAPNTALCEPLQSHIVDKPKVLHLFNSPCDCLINGFSSLAHLSLHPPTLGEVNCGWRAGASNDDGKPIAEQSTRRQPAQRALCARNHAEIFDTHPRDRMLHCSRDIYRCCVSNIGAYFLGGYSPRVLDAAKGEGAWSDTAHPAKLRQCLEGICLTLDHCKTEAVFAGLRTVASQGIFHTALCILFSLRPVVGP